MKVPYLIHVLNFVIKFILFTSLFVIFQYFQLIQLKPMYLLIIPFSFTVIGVIADWVIVPKFHNLISSLMGSIFMGATTYLLVIYFQIGIIPIYAVIFLAIGLGIIEATLHRLFVKPYLIKS